MPRYATNRIFQHYLYEIKPHDNFIREYLKKNPTATILIIGCGEGATLRQLKEWVPASNLYGIDIKKLDDCNDFNFIQHDIQKPLPSELIGACDLVFSVATFQYVADKKAALLHAHSALKPEGYGFISCEAFYYGPQAPQLFNNFSRQETPPFKWEISDYHNILMRGTAFNPKELMAEFFQYELPTALKNKGYLIEGNSEILAEIPAFYSEEEQHQLYKHTVGKNPIGSPQVTASYSFCSFLEVREKNERGPVGAGRQEYRAYRYAASSTYLRQGALSERAVVELLTTPESYDTALLKADWDQAADKDYQTYILELHKKISPLNTHTIEQVTKEHLLNKYKTSDPAKALRRAASQGNLPDVKLLCDKHTINQQDDNPETRYTALHLASQRAQQTIVDYLLEQGADARIQDAQGRTLPKYRPPSRFNCACNMFTATAITFSAAAATAVAAYCLKA